MPAFNFKRAIDITENKQARYYHLAPPSSSLLGSIIQSWSPILSEEITSSSGPDDNFDIFKNLRSLSSSPELVAL